MYFLFNKTSLAFLVLIEVQHNEENGCGSVLEIRSRGDFEPSTVSSD